MWYMNWTTDSYPIFLVKQSNINILGCIDIHAQKQQIDAEKGNK